MPSLLRYIPWFWKNIGEFFLFFDRLAKISIPCDYLERRGYVVYASKLIEIGTIDSSHKVPRMGDKYRKPDFSAAVSSLCTMIRSSYGFEEDDEDIDALEERLLNNPFAIQGSRIEIVFDELQFITSNVFLKKVMKDSNNAEPLSKAICFLSWNNEKLSNLYERFIKTGINDAEHDTIPNWFTLLKPLITMKDSLNENRVAYFLGSILQIIDKFRNYPKFTRTVITELFDLYEEHECCRIWLDRNRARWTWVENWLDSRNMVISGLNAAKSPGYRKSAFFRPLTS